MKAASRRVSAFVCASCFLSSPGRADSLEPGDPASTFAITTEVSGISQPTSFAFLPDDRMVITQKSGEVILADTTGATRNIGYIPADSSSEKGLLDVLVHPSFASNRRLIFYYSLADGSGGTNVDRHRVVTIALDSADNLDMSTETVLVKDIRGPANHDGGALAIGPDGKLYIGAGDTGCNSGTQPEPIYTPTNYFGTCLTNPNGKILRINLDGSIPTDNPLVNQSVWSCGTSCATDPSGLPLGNPRTEIWAWGFRNPWRFWFDGTTGNLWVGDVGEVTYEEVDVIPPTGGGKHYGWPWREGGKGHPTSQCQVVTPNAGDCVDPQYYCQHGTSTTAGIDGNCQSITGGLIVDSCLFPPTFRGKYFFADNAAGWLATLDPTTDRSSIVAGSRKMFASVSGQPVHLGVGPDGALYYAVIQNNGAGVIQRVAPLTPSPCPSVDAGSGGAAASGGTSSSGGTGAGGTASSGGATPGGATGSGGSNTCCGGGSSAGGSGNPDASIGGNGQARDESSCGCRIGTRSSHLSGWLLLGAVSAVAGRLISRNRRRAR